MLRFDALGLLGVLAVFLCWSLAVVLFRVASASAVTRMLAYLLVVEGVALVANGYVDMLLTSPVRAHPGYASWLHFEEVVHTLGDCAMLALYPPFLAMALQTGLTAHRGTRGYGRRVPVHCPARRAAPADGPDRHIHRPRKGNPGTGPGRV